MENLTFNIFHSFHQNAAFELGDFNEADLPTDEINARVNFPRVIPATVSLEIILSLYEDYSQSTPEKFDLSSGTAKLYARPLESTVAETELDTGSIGGTGNFQATFVVDKDTIPVGWAAFPLVRFTIEIESASTQKIRLWDDVRIVDTSANETPNNFGSSSDLQLSTSDINGTTSLANRPGSRVIRWDASSGDFTTTLPLAGTYEGQHIKFLGVASTGTMTINPNTKTVNGISGNFDLTGLQSADLHEYNGNWINANPIISVE